MVVAVKVFKKTTPNGKLTFYLGKRDFIDHLDYCDPIDGVVVVEPEYLRGRKVFGELITTYRYGREEDEVMGVKFSKELCLQREQIVPMINQQMEMTPMQERLVKKLGKSAFPFTFQFPSVSPSSVTLQAGEDDEGKPLGVDYTIRAYVGQNEEDKGHKRSQVSLTVKKLQFAPASRGRRLPSSLVSKGFTFSQGKINLEVTLDREIYYHGEKVAATVVITNNSRKTVKNIKCYIVQHCEVTMVNAQFSKHVASMETREGCPITPGASFTKQFYLVPLASSNKDRRGIALDGHLKDEDANLASSTLITDGKTSSDAMAEKSTFFMQNRHGYNIQFSPSNADIFAVATCQFFGREGGGTLFLLQLNQKGTIDEIEKIDWTDGLFDIAWAKHNPNILISACGDGTVQLWDVDSKSMSLVSGYSKPKSCYSEHGSEVCCVDWSSQDSLFLSGSWDCSIKLWNPNYKMSLKTYNGHRKLVYESKFGKKNSNIFMSASADGYLKIWDILQPYPISTILAHNNSEVLCCDWNEFDQNIVATGGSDNNIRLWDLRFVASPVIELHGCEYAIRRVRFSPFNSSVLASVSYDHTSRIWNWQYDDEAMEIITHHKESNYGLDWNRLVPNQLGDCGWDSVVNVYTPASLT